MFMTIVFTILGTLWFVVAMVVSLKSDGESVFVFFCLTLLFGGVAYYNYPDSPEDAAKKEAAFQERERLRKEDNKPRVIHEIDGCTVYKFTDNGTSRFFTRCEKTTDTTWKESCGKNCSRDMNIQTNNVKK